MNEAVAKYLEEILNKYKSGHAREHAYRPALQRLVEEINDSINAINDPKQQKVGAPDFVLLKNKTPIGYIEAKDIDVDLDKEFKTKNQFNLYRQSLNNLCFTNYLDFIFYVNGEEVQRIELAKLVDKKIEIFYENIPLFESVFKNFTIAKTISIRNPKELASLMAEKAKMLKNVIYLALQQEEEQRSIKESLSDDELAVFDLLLKENLNEKEVDQVKKTARTLLDKLQQEKLVLDWREKESTRAGVKSTIYNIVYSYLPEPTYTENDCEQKGLEVYNFVYERYGSSNRNNLVQQRSL